MDVLLLTLGRRMSDERGGIHGSHKIFYIHTHSYTMHTHDWASLHSVLHSVSLLHINYKGK